MESARIGLDLMEVIMRYVSSARLLLLAVILLALAAPGCPLETVALAS